MKVKEFRAYINEDGNPYLRETGTSYNYDARRVFNNPRDVADLAANTIRIADCAEEYCYIFCLNSKGKLTGLFEATHGTVNASLVSPREIYQKALLLGAVNIIMAHNHPSGDPSPSKEDHSVTKKIIESGKILDVELLDHIIIGRNGYYYSFKEYHPEMFK